MFLVKSALFVDRLRLNMDSDQWCTNCKNEVRNLNTEDNDIEIAY